MANPPVKSIVLKGPRPTSAQAAAMAQAQQPTLPDPRIMDSRRTVNAQGVTVGVGNPKRIAVNDRGFVTSPSQAVSALTRGIKPAKNVDPGFQAKPTPKPHVKVTVHPNGKIEVTHAPAPKPTAQVAPQQNAPAATPTVKPKAKVAPARVPAAQAAAPQQTIEQQAQTILDPVKASILNAINQRVTDQQTAITNYSKDLAGLMGQYAPASKASYGNAETGQAAIDAALASTLQGAGASGQADLAAKLAQINADPGTAARINGQAAQDTSGAVGAGAARGSASLSSLLAQGANAQDYGAKLPGVAGLYGLQATKSAQSQGTTDTANAVATLEQQLPNIVQQLKTNKTQGAQVNFERGVALLQANGNVVTPEIRKLLGGALPNGPTPKAVAASAAAAPKVDSTLSKAYGVQTDQQGRAIVGKDGKPIPYPTGGTSAPKVDLALSKAYGILVDNTATPILKNGKPVELPSTAKATDKYHGLSASKYQTEQAKAAGLARIAHEPTTDGHPGVSWQTYLTGALKQGVPWWVAIQEGKRVYSVAEIKLGLIPGSKK